MDFIDKAMNTGISYVLCVADGLASGAAQLVGVDQWMYLCGLAEAYATQY